MSAQRHRKCSPRAEFKREEEKLVGVGRDDIETLRTAVIIMTVIKAEVNIKVSYKMSDGLKVDIDTATETIHPSIRQTQVGLVAAIGSSTK